MDLRLGGKRAFITGGTHGIGLAIAHALVGEGAAVSVCGRDTERLAAAVAALRASSATMHGVPADVTDPDALGHAIDESAARLGGLDLLVANAGGSSGGDLLQSTPADWAATYAVNVLHAAHAVRAAVPHFDRAGGGVVLIVASITGWKPGPKSSYASAKAAEIHLAATLAQELGPRGIRVNALSPGSVLFDGGGWISSAATTPSGWRGSPARTSPPAAWSRSTRSRTSPASCSRTEPPGSTAPTSASTAPRTIPAPAGSSR